MARVKKQVLTFKVTLDLPADATQAQALEMLDTAVKSARGSYQPDHPMSKLDRDRISVKLDAKHTYYG